MRKKRLLARTRVLSLLLLLCLPALAQNKTITGKVTDSKDGTPLAGVSVMSKGSEHGTVTAADGSYRISVGPTATVLVFSSIGFGSMEQSINGDVVMASLTAVNTSLNEVVVIGYGSL